MAILQIAARESRLWSVKDSQDRGGGRRGRPPASEHRPRSTKQPRPTIPGTLPRDDAPARRPARADAGASEPQKRPQRSKDGRAAGAEPGTPRRSASARRDGARDRRAASGTRSSKGRESGSTSTSRTTKAKVASTTPPLFGAAGSRRRRGIILVAVSLVIIAATIAVAIFLRGQLAEREERIIAQEQDTSYEIIPCEPSMLDIALNQTGTIAGYPVTFGLSVTNTSDQSCSLDAGSEHLVLEVSSGNDQIWSSAHCPAGAGSRLYVFGPDVSSQINVEWSGGRSTPSCDAGLPAPRPGTYVVQGSVDGVGFPALTQSFVLTGADGAVPASEPAAEPTE